MNTRSRIIIEEGLLANGADLVTVEVLDAGERDSGRKRAEDEASEDERAARRAA